MPAPRPPTIGDIVEIYCSRCRLNLDASVAALLSGQIVKVMCRTCGHEVPFKPPQDMKLKKEKALEKLMKLRQKKHEGPPAAPVVAPAPVRQLWDDLTAKVDSRRAKVYDRTRKYGANEVILHKEHGMGVIHDVEQDGQLNVLFRDGFVTLASDQPADED